MSTQSFPIEPTASPSLLLPLSWEDLKGFMTQRARKLVHELVKEKGREEPPFLAEDLARLHGIKLVKTDLGEIDALLLRGADGYIIKLNTTRPSRRQPFSCAHEIGHTFLHELYSGVGTNNAEFRLVSSTISSKSKERLCDIAAAELLMPDSVFRKYLLGSGVSASSIERLAHVFKVSPETAAIRIGEVSAEPCIALKWKRFQKPKSKGFITKHNRKHIYVRDPSALLKAYETDSPVKSFKSFDIGGTGKRCLMESKGFGHDKWRYVISLVFPERQGKV